MDATCASASSVRTLSISFPLCKFLDLYCRLLWRFFMASEDSATTGTAASAASIFSRLLERIRFHVEGLAFSVETLVNLWCPFSVYFVNRPLFFKEIGLVRGFCELSCKDDNVIRCPFSVYFFNRPPFLRRLVWYEVSVNSPASAWDPFRAQQCTLLGKS